MMLKMDRFLRRYRLSLRKNTLFASTPSLWGEGAILLCCVVIACSSCGNVATNPSQSTGPWPGSLAVTFTLPTSYERALRLITDLGLQPAMDCRIGSAMLTPGSTSTPWPRWQPVGQRETFLHEHHLLVDLASPPADWFMRLKATPGVSTTGFLDPKEGVCRAVVYGTPPPGVAVPLTAVQADTYSRITFTHPLDTYDAALYAISNVGLHLVDPCYEQAWLNQKRPTWHPMGQEHLFATAHTLILATRTFVTSSLWQNQLHTLAGVRSIETPYTVNC